MEIINITKELPFVKSNGRRKLETIEYGILHHDAILAPNVYDAVGRYRAEANYHIKKGWGHLSYHIKVARDGKVYQTLPFEEIGYHAGNWKYNLKGIGICFDGDFSKQTPSSQQYDALKALLDYLSFKRPDLPKLVKSSFLGHTQVRLFGMTFCPSPAIMTALKSYKK